MADEERGAVYELACTECGAAACEVTAPAMGALTKLALSKAAKMIAGKGAEGAGDGPLLGLTPEGVASALTMRCLNCVAEGAGNG
jgi:hypothetical protein